MFITVSPTAAKPPGGETDHLPPSTAEINPLKTKCRLLYLKTQFAPHSKHFSSRLEKSISICCKWHKSLFVLR